MRKPALGMIRCRQDWLVYGLVLGEQDYRMRVPPTRTVVPRKFWTAGCTPHIRRFARLTTVLSRSLLACVRCWLTVGRGDHLFFLEAGEGYQ